MNYFAPRTVQGVRPDGSEQEGGEVPVQHLEELRELHGWILLGEPGLGKTRSFENEAKISGGTYKKISDFLDDELAEPLQNSTIFLDGLDEVRVSGNADSILRKIRNRLNKIGNPPFRISCRAADWYGSSDRQDISQESARNDVSAFCLLPLGEFEVTEILKRNHHVIDADTFVTEAKNLGVDGLLYNPQTLGLLAKSVQAQQWPKTRRDAFELACQTLSSEENKRYRDIERQSQVHFAALALLDAAGYLFAVMLLSDKAGVAIDRNVVSDNFPVIDSFKLDELGVAQRVVRTALFAQSGASEERLEPSHRSIAEYLAARWMAKQLDTKGMSLGRLLKLMLGFDERAVAGLRGLYGWLALLSSTVAQELLIENDPLTVLLYGDVKPMGFQRKKQLLDALRREIEKYPSALSGNQYSTQIGSLFDLSLEREFIKGLKPQSTGEQGVFFTRLVLQILYRNALSSDLLSSVYAIIVDDIQWDYSARSLALEVWLGAIGSTPNALDSAHNLLDAINNKQIGDPTDNLAGILLQHLFPTKIQPSQILQYLHKRKDGNFIGRYVYFFVYDLPKMFANELSGADLTLMLDELSLRSDLFDGHVTDSTISRMTSKLISQGIASLGDEADDARLLAWLFIGVDKYGATHHQRELQSALNDWLAIRPNRYKGLLAASFDLFESGVVALGRVGRLHEIRRLFSYIAPPEDLGAWYLARASSSLLKEVPKPLNVLMNEYVRGFMAVLQNGQETVGLNLDDVLKWAGSDKYRNELLEPYLFSKIPKWQLAQHRKKLERDTEKKESFKVLLPEIARIRTGDALPSVYAQLAAIWQKSYLEISGETPDVRFRECFDEPNEIYVAAQAGFRACPLRPDLPTTAEIIALHLKKRSYVIARPCLLGMDLHWEDGFQAIDALSDATLEKMICFEFTDWVRAEVPDWLSYLALSRPELVSKVVSEFISKCFTGKRDGIREAQFLAYHEAYQEVRPSALMEILRALPLRLDGHQMRDFKDLLTSALQLGIEGLAEVVEHRLDLKSLDMPQRLCWLTIGAFIDPIRYLTEFSEYVSHSWKRVELMTSFVDELLRKSELMQRASAQWLGKLIEIEAEISSNNVFSFELNALINILSGIGTREAEAEIERLLALPKLGNLSYQLSVAQLNIRQRIRESEFTFPPLEKIVNMLQHKAPANVEDLQVLALEALVDVGIQIQANSNNLYKYFWNQKDKDPQEHKNEESCRDAFLPMLAQALRPFDIECQREAHYVMDNKSDIRLSYLSANLELPIEIKGEWHADLWSAASNQLIKKYTISPNTEGHGIYLVLWFGGKWQGNPKDGGRKAVSALDLKARLETTVPLEHVAKVKVHVLDVSWPTNLRE
jgi:hypothetical protein